jgi:hypothetical protein
MAMKSKSKKAATKSVKKPAKKASPKRGGRKFGDTGPRQGN